MKILPHLFFIGLDKTFQRADIKPYGKMYKIAPMSTEESGPKTACFISDGSPGPSKTAGGSISIQAVLPDISEFKVSFIYFYDKNGYTFYIFYSDQLSVIKNG